MTKSNSIKVRLNLTFSNADVAFESLYLELLEIQTQFINDHGLVAKEQRKHLLRMLYFCSTNKHACNPKKNFQTSQITQQRADIKNVPLEPPSDEPNASDHNETITKLAAQKPTSENRTLVDKNSIVGELLDDGSRKYGSLILKRR